MQLSNFDIKQMQLLLYKPECEFEEAAHRFRLIDDQTTSVIVNWKDSMDMVSQLRKEGISYSLMKRLSQYSVNIRKHDFQLLQQAGAIEEILESFYVIPNPSFYDKEVGLITTNKWLEETLII